MEGKKSKREHAEKKCWDKKADFAKNICNTMPYGKECLCGVDI